MQFYDSYFKRCKLKLGSKELTRDRNQNSNFRSSGSGADFPTSRGEILSKLLPVPASVPSLAPPSNEALNQLPESQKTLGVWLGEA